MLEPLQYRLPLLHNTLALRTSVAFLVLCFVLSQSLAASSPSMPKSPPSVLRLLHPSLFVHLVSSRVPTLLVILLLFPASLSPSLVSRLLPSPDQLTAA